MRPIDADELKRRIRLYAENLYDYTRNSGDTFTVYMVLAERLTDIMKAIDSMETISYEESLSEAIREKDETKKLMNNILEDRNSNYIRKDTILDDIKEMIAEINDDGVQLTNDQLYQLLEREIELPLYDRIDMGDSNNR